MTPPIPPHDAERESVMSRLALPTTRILIAIVVLITGAGIGSIFWKMPTANEHHALYGAGVVDDGLVAVPLPGEAVAAISPEEIRQISLPALEMMPVTADVVGKAIPLPGEAVAAISPEEMKQISLPDLEMMPVTADGVGKYAQVYPAPAPLAMVNAEQGNAVMKEEAPVMVPAAPQKFEPMREIIEEKPISIEPVSREFAPIPTSASTTERSDELLAMFHFVQNNKIDLSSPLEPPADPFPVQPADPFPVAATPTLSTLPPLPPLQLGSLSPLLPLRKIDL